MPETIAWFVEAKINPAPGGGLTSPLASARYRCLIPARELGNLGVQSSVFSSARKGPMTVCRDLQRRGIRNAVIAHYQIRRLAPLAQALRRDGVFVIADFCDDFFDDPRFGGFQRELCEAAERLTASTPQLAESIERNTGRTATVIPDPFEGPGGTPKFAPLDERLEILWFGNHTNIQTLEPLTQQLTALSERQPLRLTIVTALGRVAIGLQSRPNFILNRVEWSVNEVWRQLAACDVVAIPSLATPHYLAKSPNRLVEALWAGRAVAAYPVPSYREFRDVCRLGEDLGSGIAWMLRNREQVEQQIAAGQELIARRYAPAVIARQWLDLCCGQKSGLSDCGIGASP